MNNKQVSRRENPKATVSEDPKLTIISLKIIFKLKPCSEVTKNYQNNWLLYLLVYKSTFYDLNFSPKNGPQLIHKSYTKKKIGFEALKMGIDLYTCSTYTRVNTVITVDK